MDGSRIDGLVESRDRIRLIEALTRKTLWLSNWMIHHANHIRPNPDGLKVGGHQASSASMAAILSALYFGVLRPEDRVAVKPHASPVFHAIQYLFGKQSLDKLEAFRGYGGAQSYPSRTKDTDDVDISTGSVGLGVAFTAFASMVQDYVRLKPWAKAGKRPEGRMIALVGDAELDEGNVYEALQEGWKHNLRNCWWVIDYNRQSLDGVVREGLYDRIEAIFAAFGWKVVTLKYGALQRAAFEEPGGHRLRDWIDNCHNGVYSALMFRGGKAWRERLIDEIGDQGPTSALLERRTDAQLAELMANLGGHCIPSLVEQFEAATSDQPTVFIAYTVKGWGTPLAGHKDNHAGQMTATQMETLRKSMNVREGHEWDKLEGLGDAREIERFLATVPFNTTESRRLTSPRVKTIGPQFVGTGATSTQTAFGKVLDAIAKTDSEMARRIVTTSPDVTVSTNLGTWVNRRHLFANEELADVFQTESIPSAQKWQFRPDGQHIELGIAEMNLFLLLGAAGLSHSLFGERLLPVGTLYDPFISRGLDALNYACYQDARFLLVATPSGVSLAGEGGAHQSIASPLIGMSQDGLASFEPAFADELSVIMDWAFDYMQRDGSARADLAAWPRDVSGGSVYLRLSTRVLEQVPRQMDARLSDDIMRGAYWLQPPTPQTEVVIAYQGVLADQAIAAAGMIGGDRRNVAVLAVTSADRLNAGWHGSQRARRRGEAPVVSHIETLLAQVPRHAGLVTAIDGHPATLSWLGGVGGHRTISLGVEHFGQTGSVTDLYRHFGIDAEAIRTAAQSFFGGH